MFRFKRGILLFLVLILLPFSSAQAMQPNEPNEPNELYWRGTVIVKWVHRARWSFPSSLGILRGMIEEYYTRTIYADGYGNATQKIEVSYFQYQQVDCIDHVGFYRRKAKDTYSTGPYLFNMVITDLQASPEYSQPGLSVIFKHELQCGQGTSESVEILDYDAAFLSPDDGEFSPILNVVHGADRYGNYVPSYAGNTGEEIVIFVTLYDLVLFDSANHFFPERINKLYGLLQLTWGGRGLPTILQHNILCKNIQSD